MEAKLQKLFSAVEKHKQMILDAERHIWKNPESGFREWKTHAYMKKIFEDLGYDLVEAGNIPGFYTDLDTGIPGPRIAVFGEMDSLIINTHPECDPETGAVHSCAHHCQCAALLGLAAALKEPGALDGFCGIIRLIAVPAEEGIEMEFRRELRKEGKIRYLSGKLEFMYRGYLDDVDIAMMIHQGGTGFGCTNGTNGSITKFATFRGKSAHAGGSPHKGINALYAATTALSAANAIRETFQEKDVIRFHPIITKGGTVVNAIPDEVTTEAYLRGSGLEAMKEASDKMNRAFAACAAAMGCTVTISDEHGYAPRRNDPILREIFHKVGAYFFPEEKMNFNRSWGGGCSDMGDVACIIPSVHPHIEGYVGQGHSDNFYINDPYTACVVSAKAQIGFLCYLLTDGGELVKKVKEEAIVPFKCKEDYFKHLDTINFEGEGVVYNEDGTVTLRYKA